MYVRKISCYFIAYMQKYIFIITLCSLPKNLYTKKFCTPIFCYIIATLASSEDGGIVARLHAASAATIICIQCICETSRNCHQTLIYQPSQPLSYSRSNSMRIQRGREYPLRIRQTIFQSLNMNNLSHTCAYRQPSLFLWCCMPWRYTISYMYMYMYVHVYACSQWRIAC